MFEYVSDQSTIYALSSGAGRAGVAVIRISGPAARSVLDRMAAPCPPHRRAVFRKIVHPTTGELLDAALVLFFAGPSSETGEDIAELQLHGSPAVVRSAYRALDAIPGCRLAEPGEFARRAFLNGKIDLTAAEGLADLIDAETDVQRRQALAQASGAFARQCDGWRQRLLEARALVEAAIDFSDESDVAENALFQARSLLAPLLTEIENARSSANRGEIVREGFRVVLAGAPNAGKSSLLNLLARRDVAIVSDEPGTTRDVIEVHLDLGGYAVIVADTAGLRNEGSSIEREGMRRTRARARDADLVVWLADAQNPIWPTDDFLAETPNLLCVLNKNDLTSRLESVAPQEAEGMPSLRISALTGEGMPLLIAKLAAEVESRVSDSTTIVLPTQERHRVALTTCLAALASSLSEMRTEPELIAEDLRLASDALGRITGRIDAEEVLGQIFGRFCIGK
ncbi:MAG: tRNA uridine-5-carboxymethylaminomethyl(34) synthesis GTPase MnmE [Hyphomicrobiaceae bacterium]